MRSKHYSVRNIGIDLVCAWIVVLWRVTMCSVVSGNVLHMTLCSVVGDNATVPDDCISERHLYIFVNFESSNLTSGLLQS
jgi:hypothetical protein